MKLTSMKLKKSTLLACICVFAVTVFINPVYSQQIEFKRNSIRTGLGIGINEGEQEIGMGLLYSIGWQRSFGEKRKLRINPNMILGGFLPIGITDLRQQFYRITNMGVNAHYDLIKYNSVSIIVSTGGFINYSRGLLGTGGYYKDEADRNTSSQYFINMYIGVNGSVGLRVDPKNSKMAFEFRPINVYVGNKYFVLGYMMFGIDFKLKQHYDCP